MNKFYGFLVLFDEPGNIFIKNLWDRLEDAGVKGSLNFVKNCIPHLSFALYEGCSLELIEKKAAEFAQENSCFEIEFSSIGFFATPIRPLFLGITKTPVLTELHSKWHKTAGLCKNEANGLYEPESWVPHATLAMGVNKINAEAAFDALFDISLPQKFMAKSLAVTEFDISNNTVSWKYQKLFPLKN